MKSIRAFIFARGGSKGIPRKNLLKINGHSLVGHSIRIAKQIKEIEKVYVSTDDSDIAEIANFYGADLINRPIELATDNSTEWLSWQHGITESFNRDGAFDYFLSLPPTAPMRNVEDILNCIQAINDQVDIVITTTPSQRSPWFNMVSIDPSGEAKLINSNLSIKRRQDSPICFAITTVAYFTRPNFILNHSNLWDGKVKTVVIPPDRAIDIDTHFDFKIAKLLMEKDN